MMDPIIVHDGPDNSAKGLCKVNKIQKSKLTMEVGGWVGPGLVGGWVQVSLGMLLLLENRHKISLNQY